MQCIMFILSIFTMQLLECCHIFCEINVAHKELRLIIAQSYRWFYQLHHQTSLHITSCPLVLQAPVWGTSWAWRPETHTPGCQSSLWHMASRPWHVAITTKKIERGILNNWHFICMVWQVYTQQGIMIMTEMVQVLFTYLSVSECT